MTNPITKTIETSCSPAEAYAHFTENTASWWPMDEHSVSAGEGKSARDVVIETKPGGAVYEIKHDGSRAEWGRVIVADAGRELSMTWHPGSDPSLATSVSVHFEGLGSGKTRVTLVHSNWEVLGDKADDMRSNYDGGWEFVFVRLFGGACAKLQT